MNTVIQNELAEIGQHFRKLFHIIPDYLRERGLLKKSFESVGTRLQREYKAYVHQVQRLCKIEIISMAKEITERRSLAEFLSKYKIPQRNLGLLLHQENLLEALHSSINQKGQDFTVDSITGALHALTQRLTGNRTAVRNCLDPFVRELALAKQTR